jgi:hypothetical protein
MPGCAMEMDNGIASEKAITAMKSAFGFIELSMMPPDILLKNYARIKFLTWLRSVYVQRFRM